MEISVERVGKVRHGGMLLEVTCRIDGAIVSRAPRSRAPRRPRSCTPARESSSRAWNSTPAPSPRPRVRSGSVPTRITREQLGFSIIAVVRDNPKELVANGVRYYHPDACST